MKIRVPFDSAVVHAHRLVQDDTTARRIFDVVHAKESQGPMAVVSFHFNRQSEMVAPNDWSKFNQLC